VPLSMVCVRALKFSDSPRFGALRLNGCSFEERSRPIVDAVRGS
jgi:hypothetical protein